MKKSNNEDIWDTAQNELNPKRIKKYLKW